MTIWEVILIGVSLSLDAFAVSIADGVMLDKAGKRFAVALTFGAFQALMPLIGYALVVVLGRGGEAVYNALHSAGHWAAMGILAILGIKMIVEGIRDKAAESQVSPAAVCGKRCGDSDRVYKEERDGKKKATGGKRRLTPFMVAVQGVATSIDALAVGISFAFMDGGSTGESLSGSLPQLLKSAGGRISGMTAPSQGDVLWQQNIVGINSSGASSIAGSRIESCLVHWILWLQNIGMPAKGSSQVSVATRVLSMKYNLGLQNIGMPAKGSSQVSVATRVLSMKHNLGLQNIVTKSLIIGVTTAVICLPAVYLGRKVQKLCGSYATIAGGVVLVALGVKIGLWG